MVVKEAPIVRKFHSHFAVAGLLACSLMLLFGCEGMDQNLSRALNDGLRQVAPIVVPPQYQNLANLFANVLAAQNQTSTMKDQSTLEQEQARQRPVVNTTQTRIVQPEIKILSCTATPETITGGQSVTLKAVYQAFGAGSSLPTGSIEIINTDIKQRVATKELTLDSAGQVQITQTLKFPNAAKAGLYSIVVVLNYGGQEVRGNAFVTVQ